MGLQSAKNPYLEWWPFVQGYELPSTPVPCCKPTAPFFKLLAHPQPSLPLIQSLDPAHKHVTHFLSKQKMTLAHWNSPWYDTLTLSLPSYFHQDLREIETLFVVMFLLPCQGRGCVKESPQKALVSSGEPNHTKAFPSKVLKKRWSAQVSQTILKHFLRKSSKSAGQLR